MGRTVPTFVQLIQEAAERWKKFRRALRREDQPHFDRLFVRVRCYTQAATYQAHDRSEEHTSELQSRLHLVCRLLLEKKKTNTALLLTLSVPTVCKQPSSHSAKSKNRSHAPSLSTMECHRNFAPSQTMECPRYLCLS